MPKLKDVRADLSLIKDLINELEKQLDGAYLIREDLNKNPTEEAYRKFVIELSKALGILSGISQESVLLVGDMQTIMQYATKTDKTDETDETEETEEATNILKSIFSSMPKGGSNRN